MPALLSRRTVLQLTALAPALRPLAAQTRVAGESQSAVSLIRGDDRRKNVTEALLAIDEKIAPMLRAKKYVVIKPNNVSTSVQLAATHADALHGILDYLEPRFRGPIVIAESSAGDTMDGFEQFGYNRLASERRSQKVQLIDLNREGHYKVVPLIDADVHPKAARLAARLMDPDAFIFSAAMLKTHDTVVATLSVKNMAMGAPLHSVPGETPRWNDKRVTHNALRQTYYNLFLNAQALKPFWGVAVIDGFQGMEGNGPSSGTPVDSKVALASTDFIAADRVGLEVMGIDAGWPGYLRYCGEFGIGQYDLSKIEVRGAKIADVARKYELHRNIQRELEYMGPVQPAPPKAG